MREKNPEKYYVWQYDRFKKIGKGYPLKLFNGVKVRNKLEKQIGNFLINRKVVFSYEQYININGKAYFPDFIIDENIILEVTEWKHPSIEKLKNLMRKADEYKLKNYKILFFIPENCRKFYKDLKAPITSNLNELEILIKGFVAQTCT